MNTVVTKLEPKWISFTFRHPWLAATAASKIGNRKQMFDIAAPPAALMEVKLSTRPPEPVIPAKKPFKAELVGGKHYSWCTCGHSRKQPFCDGSHKTRAQGLSPLRFVPEKDATVWLCGCKHTSNPPYCDGTHKQDFIVSAPLHEPAES